MRLSRRALLLGAVGAAAGCSAPAAPAPPPAGPVPRAPSSAGSTSRAPSPVRPAPSSPPAPSRGAGPGTLPSVHPWVALPTEIEGAVKLVAARLIETLGTWDAASSGSGVAASRLRALGHDPALATQLGGLVEGGRAAVAEVIDVQYGGLLAASASVLVPMRQWLIDDTGRLVQRGWTFDIRLVAASPAWRVTAVHPSTPGRPGAVTTLAAQVLGSPRIDLPPAARADVASGQVHDTVLRALLALARDYTVGVSVVRSGHPLNVFGTTRPSDHPLGRAFDTWRIDGRPVVAASTARDLVTGYMNAVADLGSYNVGGPYLLGRGVFFSDRTHHDHVHAGFAG